MFGNNKNKRTNKDIVSAINELDQKHWYNHHRDLKEKVEAGEITVDGCWYPFNEMESARNAWSRAREEAGRIEQKFGEHDVELGPCCDFHLGVINGKLSALRWILGKDWDSVETGPIC